MTKAFGAGLEALGAVQLPVAPCGTAIGLIVNRDERAMSTCAPLGSPMPANRVPPELVTGSTWIRKLGWVQPSTTTSSLILGTGFDGGGVPCAKAAGVFVPKTAISATPTVAINFFICSSFFPSVFSGLT